MNESLDLMASSITNLKREVPTGSQKEGRGRGLTLAIEAHACTRQRAIAEYLSNSFACRAAREER
jgi:hypothetical protein